MSNLLFLLVFSLCFISFSHGEECSWTSPSGRVYDLRAFAALGDIPVPSDDLGRFSYKLRVCGVVSEATCSSNNGAMCVYNRNWRSLKTIAKENNTIIPTFQLIDPSNEDAGIMLTYKNGDIINNVYPTVNFKFVCSDEISPPSILNYLVGPVTWNGDFSGPSICHTPSKNSNFKILSFFMFLLLIGLIVYAAYQVKDVMGWKKYPFYNAVKKQLNVKMSDYDRYNSFIPEIKMILDNLSIHQGVDLTKSLDSEKELIFWSCLIANNVSNHIKFPISSFFGLFDHPLTWFGFKRFDYLPGLIPTRMELIMQSCFDQISHLNNNNNNQNDNFNEDNLQDVDRLPLLSETDFDVINAPSAGP